MDDLLIAAVFEKFAKLEEYSNNIFSKKTLDAFSDLGIEISPIDLVWECSRDKKHFIVTLPDGGHLSVLDNGFTGDEQKFEAFYTKKGENNDFSEENKMHFDNLSELTEKIVSLSKNKL